MTCNLHGMIHNPGGQLETGGSCWGGEVLSLAFLVITAEVHDVLKFSWAVLYVLGGLLRSLHSSKSTSRPTKGTHLFHPPLPHFTDGEVEVQTGEMPHQGNLGCLPYSKLPPPPPPPFRHSQSLLAVHHYSGTTDHSTRTRICDA